MPREELNIERFDVGLVTAIDPKDVSLDASTDGSVNLEAMTAHGRLKGRLVDGASICYAMTGSKMSGLIYSATAYGALVTCDGSTIYTTRWFSGGFTTSELVSQGSVSSPGNMTVFNREVRVGGTTPKLCGYNENSGSESILYGDCECRGINLASVTNVLPCAVVDVTTPGALAQTTQYFYKVSIEYDNYEESILSAQEPAMAIGVGLAIPMFSYHPLPGYSSVQIIIKIPDAIFENPRVTAVNLYRAESVWEQTAAGLDPPPVIVADSLYRQIIRIPKTDSAWVSTIPGSWYGGYPPGFVSDDSSAHGYRYTDIGGDDGQTYEDRTGISGTLDSNFVNYKLSAVVNSQFVIAQCQHSEITDAGLMIFKSKANRPDMFDWIDDFIKMPTMPVCMLGFNGRLFVFDGGSMYVVNIDEMFIEDAMQGVGVGSPFSALATHHGLFILDRNMPWVHDGTELIPLGAAIIDKWRNQTWDQYSMVAWHERSGAVLFMDLSHGVAFAYSIASKRWDYWTLPASCQSAITDPSSNVMLVT